VRKILSQAGLPNKFWPLAARCWCFLDNVDDSTGDSPFNKRFEKGQVKDVYKDIKIIPFGAHILYKPQPSHKAYYNSKFDPEGRVGLFLGYAMQPGGEWSGDYLVADLADFAWYGTPNNRLNKVTIQDTKIVRMKDPSTAVFPLRHRYLEIRETLEGHEDRVRCGIMTAKELFQNGAKTFLTVRMGLGRLVVIQQILLTR
jgi:hypothetical protein